MAERCLIDTDVIVEYLRGGPEAVRFLEGLEGEWQVSAITVAELFSGVKGAEEDQALEQFLLAFEVLPVDGDLAKRGGLYRRDYRSSHGTGLADALIAASAELGGAELVTFNQRHYPMVGNVRVPYGRS